MTGRWPSAAAREAGQTIAELVVAAAILMVIVGATLAVLDTATRTERSSQAREKVLDEMRTAMQRMTKEIRQALSVDTSSTRSRLDMQTLVAGAEHGVVYEVAGGELRRIRDGGGPVPLVSNVEAIVFCFDPPDCVVPNPSSSTPTLIEITLDASPEVYSSGPINLTAQVRLRNT